MPAVCGIEIEPKFRMNILVQRKIGNHHLWAPDDLGENGLDNRPCADPTFVIPCEDDEDDDESNVGLDKNSGDSKYPTFCHADCLRFTVS